MGLASGAPALRSSAASLEPSGMPLRRRRGLPGHVIPTPPHSQCGPAPRGHFLLSTAPEHYVSLLVNFLSNASVDASMQVDDPPETTVLTALDANPTLHVSELAERVDGDQRLVDEVCYDLEVEGCVRSRTGGLYSITAKGERKLRTLIATR